MLRLRQAENKGRLINIEWMLYTGKVTHEQMQERVLQETGPPCIALAQGQRVRRHLQSVIGAFRDPAHAEQRFFTMQT